MEQNNLYDNYNFKSGGKPDNQKMPDGTLIAAHTIPSLGLSIGQRGRKRITEWSWYLELFGVQRVRPKHINSPLAPQPVMDGMECQCVWGTITTPEETAGPFNRLSVCYKFRDCIDGQSNVIFFGEVRRADSRHVQRGWGATNNGQGMLSTLIPINWYCADEDATDGRFHPGNWNGEFGFKSSHPMGVHILMGDGSTHFIKESMDPDLFNLLGAKADKEVAQWDL